MTTDWRGIILVYGTGLLAAGQLGLVAPLVPALQGELNLSLAFVGLILSVITLVGALLGLAAGGVVERTGYARAIFVGLALMTLAACICAWAGTGAMLLAARGFAGVGYLLVVVAAPSLMARLAAPRDQALALSLWGTFVPAGIALAQALSGVAVEGWGWRSIFVADVVLLAAALAIALMTLTADRAAPISGPSLRWRDLGGPPLLLAVAFFCFALTFLGMAGLLTVYFVEIRGFSIERASGLIAPTTACGALGSLAAGWLMRRGISSWSLAGAGLLSAMVLAVVVFSAAAPDWAVIAATTLSFTLGGLVPAAAFASVPLLARDVRAIGPLNGLLAQTGSLGSLLGPPLVALWVGVAGWATAPALLLAVSIIGSACVLAIRRRPVTG
jgi:MFS family permease